MRLFDQPFIISGNVGLIPENFTGEIAMFQIGFFANHERSKVARSDNSFSFLGLKEFAMSPSDIEMK